MTSYETLRDLYCAPLEHSTFPVELIGEDGTIRVEQVRAVVFPSELHNPIFVTEGNRHTAPGQSLALFIDLEPVSDYESSFVIHHQCSNSLTVEARAERKADYPAQQEASDA